MRIALTEQADIWQSLLTGQQSLRGFSVESVTQKIVSDVTNEIGAAIQKDFSSSTKQAIATVGQITENVSTLAKTSLDTLFRSFWPIAAVIGLLFIAGAAITLLAAHSSPAAEGASGTLTAIVTAAAGFFGYKATNKQKEDSKTVIASQKDQTKTDTSAANAGSVVSAGGGLEARLGSILTDTRHALLDAFERGYEQIRIEFALLNQSIGVASPLVEFFMMSHELTQVKSDYAFLTLIIWSDTDREEEIKNVARAAFGPISALLGVVSKDLSDAPGQKKESDSKVNA